MSANIQSPGSPSGSQGSRSSSGLEDLYISLSSDSNLMMKYADINSLTNQQNIDTNCFTDIDSNLDLGIENIDEIDTNNMEVYSGGPVKKSRGKEIFGTSSNSAELLKRTDGKQQQAKAVVVPPKASQGKSLIKTEGKPLPEINIDVASDNASTGDDVLAQAIGAADISPNSMAGQSMISNYDENSRVSLN